MPVGQKLEEARKRKGVSLREVSESTKIRGDYLSAIESGNYEINLPEVYLRGFVRLYAKFLGLDQDAMVADLDADLGKSVSKSLKKSLGSIVSQENSDSPIQSSKPSSPSSSHHRVSSTKRMNISLPVVFSLAGVGATAAIVIIIYLLSKASDPESSGNQPPTISEVSSEALENEQNNKESISASHLLTISISADVKKLIVCDEGKSPPVFHEYDDLVSGWTQDIEFEGSFRCYSTQLENLIISVDGSTAKKVGGDRKGTGTFSWKPER
jgi:cytoskeletal protein RodZ